MGHSFWLAHEDDDKDSLMHWTAGVGVKVNWYLRWFIPIGWVASAASDEDAGRRAAVLAYVQGRPGAGKSYQLTARAFEETLKFLDDNPAMRPGFTREDVIALRAFVAANKL